MDKKDIRSFTLEELVARGGTDDNTVYYDGCLITHTSPKEGADLLKYPIRIDARMICLCRNNGGEVISNLSRFGIKRNTLVNIAPENVIYVDKKDLDRTENLDMTVFAFNADLLNRLNLDVKQVLPYTAQFKDTSSIELTEHEMTALESALESVRKSIIYFRRSRFCDEIVRRIIESAIYMVIDICLRRIAIQEQNPKAPVSRNQEYFARFVKCLYDNYKQHRSVAFYASQLYITPKYLTTVIKSVSGRSATEWIDEYVILEAKNLLRYSKMSIQEVAYALNFPNQSFFGKYFKHHTSMSPSQYKMQK